MSQKTMPTEDVEGKIVSSLPTPGINYRYKYLLEINTKGEIEGHSYTESYTRPTVRACKCEPIMKEDKTGCWSECKVCLRVIHDQRPRKMN